MAEKVELTPQQQLDLQYKEAEQARVRDIIRRDDKVKASIPRAYDLGADTPIGSEFGLGTKYDVGISKDQLDDRAEYNAQNQTTGDKWGNAAVKMSNIAATIAVTGIPSFVLGVSDLATGGEDGEHEFSDLWNNAITNASTDWIESLEDIQQYPNLQTREEQEMGIGEKVGTANFWADGIMKNAGYAMGMVASGYGTGAIFSAINAAKITGNIAEGLVAAGKYSTIDDATLAIAKGLESKAVLEGMQLASKANKSKTVLQSYANMGLSTYGEASTEAVQSSREIYKKLSLEHPNMSDEEKKDISEKGGNATLVWNMALLSMTSARQLKGAISSFDGAKTTLNKIALNTETGLYKNATKESLEAAKKVGSGLVLEGTEEQSQFTGATSIEDYYLRVANGDVEGMTTIAKSIGEGLSKAYGTQEGWENFVTGAVLGFTGVPTVGKYKNGYVGPKMAGGVYDEIKGVQESADETASAVDKVNSVIQSDSFKNRYNNTVVSSSYEEDKTKSKTEFDFNNAESNQFIFDAETFIDAGLYSEFKEQLESVKNTDITTLRKQFDKAGVYKSLDDKELKEVVDRETEYKVSKLDAIRDLKKDISRQFPNASSDYKTQLLQYGAIVNDVESRIELLSSTIGKHNSYIQGVYDATNEVLKLQSDKAISKKDNIASTEIDIAIEEANKALEEAMAKGSPLDVKKAESITKELESLYDRRTKFGIKYLEGFTPEFQEEVDNTIKDSRTSKEEKIVQEQQVENAKKRDAEYDAATANKPVNNNAGTPFAGMSDKEQLYMDDVLGNSPEEAPIDYQEAVIPETQETAPITEQASITPEVVTPIVTPKVTKINTDEFINEDDAINQGITDATFVQNIIPNPNIDIVYESEAFEQVSDENTEPLTQEYEATPQIKTDTSKTVLQEDHYDEVTDKEIEEELKKEELFKEAKKQEDASDSISVFNQEFKRKESNLNYVQATSNDLAAGTNMKMLDPTNFPIGTKVEFRVEDIDSNPVYDKGTNIIVSWGALKSTLSPSEIVLYVPIAIYAGNEKLGYVHTDSFINPLNVVPANIPSSKEKLAKIRKSILETKGNATGTIIERGNGALKFEKDREYGKLSERSPKGKLEIVEGKLALVIPRVSDTLSIFTKRTKVLDSKNAEDIKNTVIQALAYYFTGGNPQNINSTYSNSIQKVANEYGYKLTKYEDLVSFLKIYINPQVNASGNFSKTIADRHGENNVSINHAFGINKNTDGTVDFKLVNRKVSKDYLSYNKRDGVSESELGKTAQLQSDFLTALEPVITNLYINVNSELKENNKAVYVLKEDGTIGSLSKDYDSFLRDNNTTNLSPVTEKDKEYYVVNPILKFSLDESVKPITPTDPKGTTDNSGISDKAKRASKLFKNTAERPFESTDKQVERTRDIVSNTIILGLRPELQGEVVDSIIGEVGKTFVTKKNNISVEEASEPVFNELQDSYDLLNEIIVDEKELMATGVSKAVMQTRIDNIKLVLDNKEMILRLADAKMKQSSIFKEDNFEDGEDDNSELDKVEFSKSTYSENPIDKISIEVKKLLTGIVEIDSSGEAVTNWFGYDKVYDYKPIYEQVQTMSLGLDPDINLIVENLNKKVDSFPWIKQVVDRIVNADEYIQNKLVKNLTGHENKMNYVQHSKYEGQTVYTVVDANDNGVKQVLLREWDSNLRNSKAYNVTTGEFDPTYYKPLIEEYRSWKETPDAKTLVDWLFKFGITTKEETITRVVAEFEDGNKNPLTDPSSVIYNMSVFAASTQKNILNIDSSNPLKKSSVIKFAEETATDSIEITARSFRTGGKVVQASGTNCYLVNRFRNLKRNIKLLNRTRKVPFNKDSFILNELSKDAAFRKTFSYFTMALDAFKDKEGKTNKEGEMTKRFEGEIEAIKIAEFQALRNKVRSYQTIGGKKIESKYANFLFMTTSDKPTVRGMTTKLFPIEIDTTGRPTVDTFHFLFDQLIRPEINRINQIHAFNEGKDDPNVAQPNSKDYLEAGKIFYFIPELNNADFIWSNKAAGKLDPFIADPNSDVYARVVNEYLKPQLIAEVDAKVKLWKESGIGFSADGKFPFLDAKYMNNIVLPQAEGESLANYVNRKVRVAAIDMAMQYKVAYANQFGTFFSDPTNYFKGDFKYKSSWENAMSTWDNIAKRLAGAIAPRMEFQHPDKNIKYMFVTDPRTSSYNMEGVKDQSDKDQDSYNKQKEADAQEWITLSEKIGNMMANGDIKTNGLGKHIREVIAREVAKDNFDYMDVLEDSIESKFGEAGLKEFKSFVYQPEKPIYYGTSIDSKTNLENVLYVKSSAMVMLPSGSPTMNKLRAIAEKNGVQRIVTSTTATKLGAVKDVLDPWVYTGGHVTDINEKLLAQDVSSSTLTVSREGWGIQLEKQYDADSHEINKVSQAAKNFINGMLEVGGFEINGEFMDGDAVRDHFNRINKQIYESQYNALLKELDAVVDESGNILSIDVNKIRNMLIKEGIEKGYNIIELETFMLDPELSGITFAPNAGKIEPLLNSMVSNNVLKIKMFGKGLTLGAETMYVGDLSKSKIITTDSWTGRLLPSRVVKENTTDSFAMFKSALEKVCD